MHAKILNDSKIKQSVRFLSHAFKDVSGAFGKSNIDPETRKQYQIEFCYLIDSIERGPRYRAAEGIAECNNLIRKLESLDSSET